MNCGCSSAAGWARWIAIFLFFAVGVAISVFHTREVHQCNVCETVVNDLGEPERVCSNYKGMDMNWADLEECSQLTLILTTVGFLLSFGLALFICLCMACLPPPGSKENNKTHDSRSNGASNNAQRQAQGKPNGTKQGTNGPGPGDDDKDLKRPKKPTPVAVAVTAGHGTPSPNESAYASPHNRYQPVSTGAAHPPGFERSDRSGRMWTGSQSNPWSSPAHSSPLGQHEPVSASRSSQLGHHEFARNHYTPDAPMHEEQASDAPHQGGGSTSKDRTVYSHAQSANAASTQASQSTYPSGGAPASQGTYPVDAWLEGRDHIDNGEDNLAPIHKVESLMNGISLKDVVAAAPENPVANDNNSMHADYGDTQTTANTFTTNTYTTTHTTTNTPGLGVDTMQSTPGVAGDTQVSTPPHTPTASHNNTMTTAGVGRPPATTSGQLQPVSQQSTGNFGFGVPGNMFHSAGNTTGPPESSIGLDTRSGAPDMLTSPTTSFKETSDRRRSAGPPAAAAHVELDLSPQPSGSSLPKVSYPGSFAGQDIWSKDHTADSVTQGDSIDSTKAAYRDSAMLAVHLKEGDVAGGDGRPVPVAQVAAHAGEGVHVRALEGSPDRHNVLGGSNGSSSPENASNAQGDGKNGSPPLQSFGSAFGPNLKAQAAGGSQSGSKVSSETPAGASPGTSGGEDGVQKGDAKLHAGQQALVVNGDHTGESNPDNARSSAPTGGSATAGMPAASRVRSSQESALSGSEYSTGAKTLSGAAGDRDDAQMAWGWSGADKGWAKVPQDLAIVSKPAYTAEEAAPAGQAVPAAPAARGAPASQAVQAAPTGQAAPAGQAAPVASTAPPVRRAHWLMMDKVSSSELKEAGVGSGSDTQLRDKKKRGVQGKPGSKLHADQTIYENEVARVSVHDNATGRGVEGADGQNTAQQPDEFSESGMIGMPAPPMKAPVQATAQQKGSAAAPEQVGSADKTRSKPFGWKALDEVQHPSNGSKSKPTHGRGTAQGRGGPSWRGSQPQGSQGSKGAGTSEKTAPSRGRANILGWLERGEEAMKDTFQPRKGPMDALESGDERPKRSAAAAATGNGSKSRAARSSSGSGTPNTASRVAGSSKLKEEPELAYNLAYSPYAKSRYPTSGQHVQGLDSEGNVLSAKEFREGRQ